MACLQQGKEVWGLGGRAGGSRMRECAGLGWVEGLSESGAVAHMDGLMQCIQGGYLAPHPCSHAQKGAAYACSRSGVSLRELGWWGNGFWAWLGHSVRLPGQQSLMGQLTQGAAHSGWLFRALKRINMPHTRVGSGPEKPCLGCASALACMCVGVCMCQGWAVGLGVQVQWAPSQCQRPGRPRFRVGHACGLGGRAGQ